MKYYWIDGSCDGPFKPRFENFIIEARALARRAVERLESPTDTDFARIFNVIFKTPKTATERFPLPDFYFQLNGQKDLDRALRPTKSIPDQVIEANAITIGEPKGSMGPKGDKNPKRNTIDILPTAWRASRSNLPLSVQGLKAWIVKKGIPYYPPSISMDKFGEGMMTLTVAHEFMHTHAYRYTDVMSSSSADQETAGWGFIMKQTKKEAYWNAEAIALIIIAAGFADLRPHWETTGGYTLDRSWDKIPGSRDPPVTNMKWNPGYLKNDAAKGIFKFHKDMTL